MKNLNTTNEIESPGYVIYKYTCLINGKAYIGQTKNMYRREYEHQKQGGCRYFSAAIRKYGIEAFSHELLQEGLTLDEANHWEPFYIKEHDTLNPKGYNLATGGNNSILCAESLAKMIISKQGQGGYNKGVPMSEDQKKKLSLSKIGKPSPMKGKKGTPSNKKGIPLSDEQKAKMSLSMKGRVAHNIGKPISEEQKMKFSLKMKGRPAHNKGVPMSEEQKLKVSESRKGKGMNRFITEETRAKISAIHKGKIVSDETREKMSIAAKKRHVA